MSNLEGFCCKFPCRSSKTGGEGARKGSVPPVNPLQMQAKHRSGRYRTKVTADCKFAAKAASKQRRTRSATAAVWRRRDLGKPGGRDHIRARRFRRAAMS